MISLPDLRRVTLVAACALLSVSPVRADVPVAGPSTETAGFSAATGVSSTSSTAADGASFAASFQFLGCDPDEDRAGYAASGYVIPASLLNDDFTLRFVYQTGEFLNHGIGNGGDFPYLRFADRNWAYRVRIGHQSSPFTFWHMGSGPIMRPGPNTNDGVIFKGAASIEGWEDTFLVYHRNDASLVANAFWELDEPYGVRKDGSQRKHDLTPIGTVGSAVGHTVGNPGAAVFSADNRTAYLATTTHDADGDLDFSEPNWTIAFRIRKTSATLGSILSKRGSGGDSIDIKADTNLRFFYSATGVAWKVIDGPEIPLDAWRHVIVRCTDGTISMRVDGGDWTTGQLSGSPAASTAAVTIGRQIDMGDALDAAVDNMGVWQRSLSDSECAALYDKSHDGYLRLYRGADQMSRCPGSPAIPWDHEIPAGVDNDWKGEPNLRVILGSNRMFAYETSAEPSEPRYKNLNQDLKVYEVALWTEALDTDRASLGPWRPWSYAFEAVPHYASATIGAIAGHPVRILDDDTARRARLYLLYEGTDAGFAAGTIRESMGAQADLAVQGRSRLSRRLPAWPGVTADTLPAAPADGPTDCDVTASAIDASSIRIDAISRGTSPYGPVDRTVYVHRGNDPEHASVYTNILASETALDGITVPTYWDNYRVTVDWVDIYGNVTRKTASVTMPVPAGEPNTSLQSLAFEGRTDTYSSGNWPLPVNRPMTLRFYVKQTSAAAVESQLWAIEDGLSGTDGYDIVRIGVGSNTLSVNLCDGDKLIAAGAPEETGQNITGTMALNVWQEWWVQILRPTSTQRGYIRLYRSNQGSGIMLVDSADLPEARDWWTDWSFKKWWGHIRLGDNQSLSVAYPGFKLASLSWWTRILDPSTEMRALSWVDLATLTRAQRFGDDLYWHVQPAPSSGVVPPTFGYGPAAHDLDIQLGSNVSTSDDVPFAVKAGPTLDDVAQALQRAGGLSALTPGELQTYDLAPDGTAPADVNLSDAVDLARRVAGLT